MKYLFLHPLSLILALVFFAVSSCDQKDKDDQLTIQPIDCAVTAVATDLSGLDGCGFVFVVEDSNGSLTLEPTNLAQFSYLPTDGETVCINYVIVEDAGSICMVGTMVELTSLLPVND